MKKSIKYIAAYLLLLPILFLGIWLFILGRDALSGLLSFFYVGTSFTRQNQAEFADRMYVVFAGVGWMALFVTAEELIRRSLHKGRLVQTFLRFMGVETTLALLFDGIQVALLTGLAGVGWLRWLILGVELVCAAAFLFLGWSKRSPFYRPKVIPGLLNPS